MNFLLKHFYVTLNILILAVTCSSTIHTERIVAFPLQQSLTRTCHNVKLHVTNHIYSIFRQTQLVYIYIRML